MRSPRRKFYLRRKLNMWFMGVDMGTSGCKAVVFNENWNVVEQAYREYPLHLPGEGLLELDAELVWAAIKEVIREVNEKTTTPIDAFAVSAIGDVIIPVDEHGDSVRYSIVDFDPRGGEEITGFTEKFGVKRFFGINGMPPLYIGSLAKILYIRDNEPEVFKKTKRWATYEDFIVNKLGLPPVASFSELSRTMLFDIRKKQWSKDIIDQIPLSIDQLPQAAPSGTVIGVLPEAMGRELGFKRPVSVVTGGHDMVCAAVGAGLDENDPSTAVDIAGTIEGLVAFLPEANTSDAMLENLFPCYVGQKGYVTFSVNLTAGCIVRWYRDNISKDEYVACKADGRNFYEYMQREADPKKPGSLLMLPHFSGSGNPFFDPNSLGAIYGLTLDTRREDICRALVEGLCYELKLHLEAYRRAGIEITSIRAVGGGATVDKQLQLKANALGLKVVKGAVAESSAMGAAAYAACGMGALTNPADAYQLVKEKEFEFLPDPAATAEFEKAYARYRDFAYRINDMEKGFAR